MKSINHHIRTPEGRSLGAHYPGATAEWIRMTPEQILESFRQTYEIDTEPTESDIEKACERYEQCLRAVKEGYGSELPKREDWPAEQLEEIREAAKSMYSIYTPRLVLVSPMALAEVSGKTWAPETSSTVSVREYLEACFKVEFREALTDTDDLYFFF